ncbi:carboxypeptidase regulatory-like domain-containing protein [Bremerella cremea]|uniref:Carboxypeptidase regulatory-like domain-containing protein n=1 Tax=Bremerella cremea TaxID=1031537 RepID=A0A368KRC2_9BACT|nr:carboxypeptidase regulatory-like domain-containing protein [Bremerella cremea]RCS46331.1 carboxypeptidase regulatory-like domain-containing protein [Bremerella cremea]
MTSCNFQPGIATWIVILTVSILGCAEQDYGDLGKVTGTVTVDGQPYSGALVTFTPEEGRPSRGMTDAAGNYELIYIRDTKGAEPGKHLVAITTVPPEQPDDYKGPEFREPIPAKYNVRSELDRTVELGPNTFDFELTKK